MALARAARLNNQMEFKFLLLRKFLMNICKALLGNMMAV